MDVVGKVQHRGAGGQLEQVSAWGKDKYFVLHQVHAELVHKLHIIIRLQRAAHIGQPFLYAALPALHALIAPVGSQAVLRYVIHTLGAYLYLHPFLLGAQHRYVQTLVSVALGY